MMVQLWRLFAAFFQIGLFSIGGGYAVIPLIQEQVVDQYQWISRKMYTDIITISQMTPGPLAVNTSTFVGLQIAGIKGAVAATAGCVCTGILISLLLYRFFARHRNCIFVFEILKGLKSASLGLIISAAVTILLLAFGGGAESFGFASVDWFAVAVFCCTLLLLRKYKVNPVSVMLASGVIGAIVYGPGFP